MEIKEIQDIIKLVNKTDLTEVEIENKGFKLKIRRKQPESNVIYTSSQPQMLPPQAPVAPADPPEAPAPSPQASAPAKSDAPEASAPETEEHYTFKSPMIGTFYRASTPEADPYVKVGDRIEKGQVVCIIEAMKLFNEIESEIEGKVIKVLVEDAQPVEYDQPLFIVDLNA